MKNIFLLYSILVWGLLGCSSSHSDCDIYIDLDTLIPLPSPLRDFSTSYTVDTVYYQNAETLFENISSLDSYPRGMCIVKGNNLVCLDSIYILSFLAEITWMMKAEQNRDVICDAEACPKMNLLINKELLLNSKITHNFHIKKCVNRRLVTDQIPYGKIGFGTWNTQVEFRDIKLWKNGRFESCDISHWWGDKGQWIVSDNMVKQTSMELGTRFFSPYCIENHYELTFQVRRLNGNEGFLLYFGLSEDLLSGYYINVGGWNNKFIAVESLYNGPVGKILPFHLRTKCWYDAKLVSTPNAIQLYINSRLSAAYNKDTALRQFYSVGYDEKAENVIIKVVNAAKKTYTMRFSFEGKNKLSKIGNVIILLAKGVKNIHSKQSMDCIIQRQSMLKNFGNRFSYEFPPLSYTIIKLKIKK